MAPPLPEIAVLLDNTELACKFKVELVRNNAPPSYWLEQVVNVDDLIKILP